MNSAVCVEGRGVKAGAGRVGGGEEEAILHQLPPLWTHHIIAKLQRERNKLSLNSPDMPFMKANIVIL